MMTSPFPSRTPSTSVPVATRLDPLPPPPATILPVLTPTATTLLYADEEILMTDALPSEMLVGVTAGRAARCHPGSAVLGLSLWAPRCSPSTGALSCPAPPCWRLLVP